MENPSIKMDICFVAIVKDEAPRIKRCLDSVCELISNYVICDTGSTDGTPDIIKKHMDEKNIPGHVIHKEWKNFGYNKSWLLEQAYTNNLSEGARYLIWTDGDDVLVNADTKAYPTQEDKERLLQFLDSHYHVGMFDIVTKYGDLTYQRCNIVRNDQLFKWEMPAHEYLIASKQNTQKKLVDFIILWANYKASDKVRPQRNQLYIKWFNEWLEEHPNEPRATFYLAQSYQDEGDYENAVETYKKRIEIMTGFYQERYISMLRLGRIYKSQGKNTDAEAIWLRSLKEFPKRRESAFELLFMYCDQKQFFKGYQAVAKPYPNIKWNEYDLFVEHDIYLYKYQMQASVVAHYAGQHEDAFIWGKDVLDNGTYSDASKKILEKNMEFYQAALEKHCASMIASNSDCATLLDFEKSKDTPQITIIDNFYPDPDVIRNFALQQEFTVKGNFPGERTVSFATDEHKKFFEHMLNGKITYWPVKYNGSFQITTESMKSWIHRDLTDYSAMVYLTPDAPVNGGTLLYKHKDLAVEYENENNKKRLESDSYNEDQWDVVDKIGNKYNRMVIFSGRRSHRSDQYFGDCKENGRLFQVFFFNLLPNRP